MGIPNATTTTIPVITSYLASGSVINATGNVTVEAFANDTPSQPFTDLIQGVNPSTGTITFPSHGLVDGDLVQYDPNGDVQAIQTPNGPLNPSRTYRTIVTGPNTLKLGTSFPAVAASANPLSSAAGVDSTQNVIQFAGPDQFVTGDAVRYDTNGKGSISSGLNTSATYYVRTINLNTIKLYPSFAAATAPFDSFTPSSQVSSNTFNFNNLGFTNNEAVTYQAPAPQIFTTGGLINGDQIQVASTSGLQTGDKVIYQTNAPAGTLPITELTNGGTYFVIVVDSTTLELDASQSDATSAHPSPLSLTAGSNGAMYTELLQQPAIGGLTNGDTYYVVNAHAGSFQLASAPNGAAITLNTAGTSGRIRSVRTASP